MTIQCRIAEQRGVIAIAGEDRVAFLQGLVSGDVKAAAPDRAIWAALLTPQGKYLHDFFVADGGHALLLDCEAARGNDLAQKLKPYRLRSKVAFEDRRDDWRVAVLWGEGAAAAVGLAEQPGAAGVFAGGVAFVDPRMAEAGVRVVAPAAALAPALRAAGAADASEADWNAHRMPLGLTDGSADIDVGKAILLEYGFDELNGVSWTKGCYMGQELTARTKYRGLVKKRLTPVRIEGDAPPIGADLTFQDERVGELRSIAGEWGFALVKRTALAAATDPQLDEPGVLRWRDTRLAPHLPGWLEASIHPEDAESTLLAIPAGAARGAYRASAARRARPTVDPSPRRGPSVSPMR
ncbi:MAG: hypothetical protein AAF684_05970, partial [Pseudomonadota bacterium]